MRITPSLLAWLRCFSAVARAGSFSGAARDLFITPGAVSQQVKCLEEHLGCQLFVRGHRTLSLTNDGQHLATVVHDALDGIGRALVRVRKVDDAESLMLSCPTSFAMGWLTPRLGNFFRQHPDAGLRITGEFNSFDRDRILRSDLPSAICYDIGNFGDLASKVFMDEWIVPVATSRFLKRHPGLTMKNLKASMLLHDSTPWYGGEPESEWREWLDHFGGRLPVQGKGHYFNLSAMAVSAALADQGIAMGRASLVFEHLADGRLLAPFPQALRSKAQYFLVTVNQPSQKLELVSKWLNQEAEAFGSTRAKVFKTLGVKVET